MKLFKIHVEHFSQRSSHKSVEAYLIADSDESVYKWVDEKTYGEYTDRNDGELIDIYNDKYDVIGQETFKEKMLRIGGDLFDDDYDAGDRSCGATIYGWEKIDTRVFNSDYSTLIGLGIAEVITND